MENQRFGRLVIVGPAPSIRQTNGKMKRAVLARCDCGAEKVFLLTNLRGGNSKSCGCGKYQGFAEHNTKRAEPQSWTIEGDVASLVIGETTVLIDAADLPVVAQYKWGLGNGYAVARGGRLAMHRLILGLNKGDPREGDHRHHNTTDNRRSELRIATSSQNKMNTRGKISGRTSRFKGVHFDSTKRRWTAQIKIGDKHKFIGRYITEEAAASAYADEARKYFGEYAYTAPTK